MTLPDGTDLHRFYTAAYDPIYFDRSDLGRFNAPDGSYGVLYVAQEIPGAFAETFLRSPVRSLINPAFLVAVPVPLVRLSSGLKYHDAHCFNLARTGSI
ncbi:RES domain-containing protein (plasmid) [Rhizobium gallicum bv. gallicum R602sp]|uniref:RES domain-containing protein n=2 Tax=Rhizobium gallicum TaxID=56730 RepID=A0A0B4XDC8_9HYPH|nr:RES domain-containing protein [Rhizobium gallicum bv. gallicum R602sp]